MKKQWISAAVVLLLMLLIPITACADVIYPAPDALVVGETVDYLLAALDPGGTVWADPALLPDGLRLETAESEEGVNVYLRGTPTTPGDYSLVVLYNDTESICTISVLPAEEPEPAVPVSVTVETLPLQTSYTVGDTLDPDGLTLRVEMSDGSSQLTAEDYALYPTRLEKAGTVSVEVNYQGLLCFFDVEVAPAPEAIEGIGVLKLPVKVSYRVGEELDPGGLMIRVYTNNGTRDVYTDLVCEPTLLTEAGTQEITVHYMDHTCSFSVQVLGESTPAGIAVYRLPNRLDYAAGEQLDPTGLVLIETDSLGATSLLEEGFTCEPIALETPGRQVITVRLGQLSCSFQVNVMAPAAPSAAPQEPQVQPAQPVEPAPVIRSPEAEAVHVKDPGQETQSGKLLVAVIAVAALLALCVLGVYVFVMNRSGREYYADSIRDLFRRK